MILNCMWFAWNKLSKIEKKNDLNSPSNLKLINNHSTSLSRIFPKIRFLIFEFPKFSKISKFEINQTACHFNQVRSNATESCPTATISDGIWSSFRANSISGSGLNRIGLYEVFYWGLWAQVVANFHWQ